MRALNETEKYISSIEETATQTEEKDSKEILEAVKELVGGLTSAVKDLEGVMVNVSVPQEEKEETENEENKGDE